MENVFSKNYVTISALIYIDFAPLGQSVTNLVKIHRTKSNLVFLVKHFITTLYGWQMIEIVVLIIY